METGGRQQKGREFIKKISGKLFGNKSVAPAGTDDGSGECRQTENCMVCSNPLQYQEKAIDVTCSYCQRPDTGHITCPGGHYICERCHNQDAMRIIEDIMDSTISINPYEISELAMSIPNLPMLGCAHAYIAGGALMAALKNDTTAKVGNDEIKEVFKRTRKQAHGGYCGLTGVCGIAPAIGACTSILTGSKCGKDQEQRTTMEAVSQVTRAITNLTGPSCCKAYVRISLGVAVDFLRDNLAINLPTNSKQICQHMDKHPHGCRQDKCPYFALGL